MMLNGSTHMSMPSLIEFGNAKHAMIIASTLAKPYCYEADYCVSRSIHGRLLGGIIYQNYTGVSVQAHLCSFARNWGSRSLVYYGFYYPFHMLKVRKLIGAVSERNVSMLNLAFRLGFREEHRMADVVADGSLVILSMVPSLCRWLAREPCNCEVLVHEEPDDVRASRTSAA